jgi:hypothetical protein
MSGRGRPRKVTGLGKPDPRLPWPSLPSQEDKLTQISVHIRYRRDAIIAQVGDLHRRHEDRTRSRPILVSQAEQVTDTGRAGQVISPPRAFTVLGKVRDCEPQHIKGMSTEHLGLRSYPFPFEGTLSPRREDQAQRPGDGIQASQRRTGASSPLPGRWHRDTRRGKHAADRSPRDCTPAGARETSIAQAKEIAPGNTGWPGQRHQRDPQVRTRELGHMDGPIHPVA